MPTEIVPAPAARPEGWSVRSTVFEQPVAVLEQVVDDRPPRGRRRAPEAIRALVAPVALLPLDREFLDVALVRARPAHEVARRLLERRQVVAAEPGDAASGAVPAAGDERHPDRAHDAVVRRHRDRLAEDRGEGRRDRVVVRRAPLEVDHVADVAAADDPVQVVEGDRVRQPRDQVRNRLALVQPAGDVALHEHRAALAELGGRGRRERQPGELVLDADPELVGLLLEERPGAGGARLVHREVDDDAVLEGDELGVLSADLEDRVDRRAARGPRSRGRRRSCAR